MNCDFSGDDLTCPRCGFTSPVARLYVPCDAPPSTKQAAARIALEAAAISPSLAAALPPPPPAHGPGTELKKLLAAWPWRLVATDGCACNGRAMLMNEQESREPGWCEANINEIVNWLREEARARGLPFLDVAGRLLIRRAIKNARRAQK